MIEGDVKLAVTRPDFPWKIWIIQKLSKISNFWQFLIFCKKLRNTNEKRMSFLKSPVFFWSPLQISGLGKVWFIQKWVPSDPDWRVFCDFWPFWMNHNSKSTCVSKMIFWILKEILEDYLPWKSQPQRFSGSWNKAASVFYTFWMIQNFFLEKLLLSTQNPSIRKNNMFWAIFKRSTLFPLRTVPDLEIFRSKMKFEISTVTSSLLSLVDLI